jgi:hypothetical protein
MFSFSTHPPTSETRCYTCNSIWDVRPRLYRSGGHWLTRPVCDECVAGWAAYDDQFHGGDRRIREMAESRNGVNR